MNLLTVENISKSFGELVLFENLSFGVNKDQKIAFIAKNGTGKTSILKMLSGADLPDTGKVNYRKGIRVSFLEQEPDLNSDLTIEETIFASDSEVLKVISAYEQALENPEDEDAYQTAFEAMEQHQAWDFETQYKQILFKLKLEDLHLKVGLLSGGQKKRLALANALINKPELLIPCLWLRTIAIFWSVCAMRSLNWIMENCTRTKAIIPITWKRKKPESNKKL